MANNFVIERIVCPECDQDDNIFDYHSGEIICGNCGVVLQPLLIDHGIEWCAYNSEEQNQRSRIGSPLSYTIFDKGLSTIIDRRDQDARGHKLTPQKRMEVARLRRWQMQTRYHTSVEKNLSIAMGELERVSAIMGLQKSIKETAALIYRRVLKIKSMQCRNIVLMMTASIYLACRQRNLPLSFYDFSKDNLINRRNLLKYYRHLLQSLKIHSPSVSPMVYISKFSHNLRLSYQAQDLALKILLQARTKGLFFGKDPIGLAAAAIYLASQTTKEKRSQREIAHITNTTEVTIRVRSLEFKKRINLNTLSGVLNPKQRIYSKIENSANYQTKKKLIKEMTISRI